MRHELVERQPMTGTFRQAVADALAWLMTLSRERVRPEAARSRLQLLRQQHPETQLELLWEEEAYDGSVHYDLLLHLPEGGTLSLSFCPDSALPWSLRGAHRWSEADLVRVNQCVLKVDQAIACLDFIWNETPLIERLLDACLIEETLEKEPIELPDAELQSEVDAFRRARRLYTAAETHAWIERHGITHEKLERLVASQARVARLRERVTDRDVEACFAARRAEFDTARIARIDFPDEERARQVAGQARRGEAEFHAAAQRRFMERAARPAASPRPLFEVVRRGQLPRPLADATFAVAPGQVVGPIRVGGRYALVRVLSLTPARLDEPTRQAIQEILFAEWLAERRRTASIEWCWGNARQTSQAV
jgi:putative peptide maturation system protein